MSEQHEVRPRPKQTDLLGRLTSLAGALALVIVALVFIFRSGDLSGQVDTVSNTAQVAQSKANQGISLAQQLVQLCDSGSADVQQLQKEGLCSKAAVVQQPLPTVVAAPVSTDEIAAQVATYLQAHPPASGRAPNQQEILSAVAQVYAQNPPADGKTPSSADVLAVVTSYCSGAGDPCRGAPGLNGTNGADGQPGQNGKDGADGKPGADGAQGVSFQSLRFEAQSDGSCLAVVTMVDPKTGATSQTSQQVNPMVCPPVPPTSTSPTP